ncbi:Nucleotide-binding universal stress protein, UspA family [Halogranum amylolyticum]|uniref:Nucleotide-binding universal stress protein, UspA family n=1 Tax=Halogranum amylolyticum TaxID=660520 RepID=A0A1H8V5A4_9EURY|nr:universal stress protein [Halogranum amylolyticum]SEP10672.1 Nucleotide-binding universal stress protein, UspA family [Halogranum amylolyticum]
MYQNVLVPTDGSRGAEGAIARAFDLARIGDGTVHVLYVVDTGSEPSGLATTEREELRQRSEKRGRKATARIQERATELGLDTVRVVREGVPHRGILDYVADNDIDLVVMGTHGLAGTERSRLGSTTERVITLADVPVMAVRLAEDIDVPESGYGMYDHVVIPTDGSEAAERAATQALEIAERYGATVHVIYVVDTATYGFEDVPRSIVGLLKEGGQKAVDEIATDARDRNLPVTTDILRGVPHEAVLEYAERVDADVITMGTRGRTGDMDRLLGSTTARIVRRSDVPVLAIS